MKSPISKFTIHGNSMSPNLKEGTDILTFNWNKIKVGDVVVIKNEGKEIVKRVQSINGREVFVQGDNKEGSTDSRHFGPINIDQVVGKVVYRTNEVPCLQCGSPVVGIYGRKDATCGNCGFKLSCCE